MGSFADAGLPETAYGGRAGKENRDADIYSFEWASNQETAAGFTLSFSKNATVDNLIVQSRPRRYADPRCSSMDH